MPDSSDNIRFQVLLNCRVASTVGFRTCGTMTAIVSWVRDVILLPSQMNGGRSLDS